MALEERRIKSLMRGLSEADTVRRRLIHIAMMTVAGVCVDVGGG